MADASPLADLLGDQRLVLASASPRRLDLLRAAGVEPVVAPADVDESPSRRESPLVLVERLARAKALAVLADDDVVLGADTEVVLDDEALGKPRDAADAAATLRRLSGRAHEVLTGVALAGGGRLVSGVVRTTVRFRALDDDEIGAYVASGEPLDKAGSYAIQGGAATFVESIDGDLDNVIGLPIRLVEALLRDLTA